MGEPVVIHVPRPGATAAVGLWLRCGSAHEPAELAGITHLIEHLLLRRTEGRTPEEIAERIDSLGGDVDAFTTRETCAITAHVPATRWSEALELLRDAFLTPRFLADEVAIEQAVVDAEFDMVQDSPGETVAEQALLACWNGHPLARPVLGDRDVVGKLGVNQLQQFHRDRFDLGNAFVVAVGPMTEVAVREVLPGTPGLLAAVPTLVAPEWHAGVAVEERDGLEQVYVNLTLPGLPLGDPDRLALGVLHQLLGVGNSSRLFRELRDTRGLVYDVSSAVDAASTAGVLEIVFSAPSRNLSGCWDGVARILAALARGEIGEREVDVAKEALQAGLVLGAEGADALLEAHAGELLARGRLFDFDEALRELDAVTVDRVRGLARRLVRHELIGGAICGPPGGVRLPSWLRARAA